MKRQRQKNKKIILGLTGSFGSGKSTVARILASRGGLVIDADKIARQVIIPGRLAYRNLVSAFGGAILKGNGSIDREQLAALAFKDKNSLEKLNRITHPEIIRRIKRKLQGIKRGLVVLDAPLLLEAGLEYAVDKVAVVKINKKIQIERLFKSTSLSKAEILRRVKVQMPLKDKLRFADFIIDNSGTIEQTRRQVEKIWISLVPPKAGLGIKFVSQI